MKIAIASQGQTPQDQTAPRAGRAPYYLIFNNGELEETVTNPYAESGGGAGPSVAQMLADKEVEQVILEQVGPKMEMALKEKNVQIKETESGKVEDVLKSEQ